MDLDSESPVDDRAVCGAATSEAVPSGTAAGERSEAGLPPVEIGLR